MQALCVSAARQGSRACPKVTTEPPLLSGRLPGSQKEEPRSHRHSTAPGHMVDTGSSYFLLSWMLTSSSCPPLFFHLLFPKLMLLGFSSFINKDKITWKCQGVGGGGAAMLRGHPDLQTVG